MFSDESTADFCATIIIEIYLHHFFFKFLIRKIKKIIDNIVDEQKLVGYQFEVLR